MKKSAYNYWEIFLKNIFSSFFSSVTPLPFPFSHNTITHKHHHLFPLNLINIRTTTTMLDPLIISKSKLSITLPVENHHLAFEIKFNTDNIHWANYIIKYIKNQGSSSFTFARRKEFEKNCWIFPRQQSSPRISHWKAPLPVLVLASSSSSWLHHLWGQKQNCLLRHSSQFTV